ncbi:MAG: transporter substrate-binding domain-containing protein [Alphaproteobacteria bacterium]|nr:transporter substrate-binding domain-containing protein [Alphaproteobacteria bacterium]
MKTTGLIFGAAALLAAGTASAETMKVAADVGYAPHVMASVTGGVEGYNVDIIEEMAKRMGVEAEVIDQEWSGIFAGLAAGKYVVIIAPTTVTEERAKNMLFGEPYFEVNYQFLIKKGAPQINSLDDLAGKKIAVNKGNFFDKWLSAPERMDKYKWELVRFGKNADAIQAVATGRADANLAGDTVMGWTAQKNPLVEPSNLVISTGRVGAMAFHTTNEEMRKKFEVVMECMKADGTIAKIHEKWTGQKPTEGGAAYKVVPGIGVPGFANYDETPSGSGC